MNYGYVRVSSTTQNIDRQIEEMYKKGLKDKEIFIDKISGKDFNRPNYKLLKNILKNGDLLIIKSIDRLGRNYTKIIEEWHEITKNIGADIWVLDMPLLDTRTTPENLVGTFISDIVLQILSFVAQNEREYIRSRQAEGIKLAKAKGKHLGRPKYNIPHNFKNIVLKYKNKELDYRQALAILKMSKATFYKYLKMIN